MKRRRRKRQKQYFFADLWYGFRRKFGLPAVSESRLLRVRRLDPGCDAAEIVRKEMMSRREVFFISLRMNLFATRNLLNSSTVALTTKQVKILSIQKLSLMLVIAQRIFITRSKRKTIKAIRNPLLRSLKQSLRYSGSSFLLFLKKRNISKEGIKETIRAPIIIAINSLREFSFFIIISHSLNRRFFFVIKGEASRFTFIEYHCSSSY